MVERALIWGEAIALADVENLDPMSLWIAGAGRAFASHLVSEAGKDGVDFRFVAAIDAADPIASLSAGRSLVAIMNEDMDANTGLVVEDLKSSLFYTKLGMENPRLFLLPLRSESVLTPEAREALRRIEPKDPPRGAPRGGRPRPQRPVIGIIDHGINFAHERFRDGRRTRVKFAWDQGGRYSEAGGVPFGREFTASEINRILEATDGDDAEALRRMELADFERPGERPLARAHSHGTHVLDLAAGAGGFDDDDDDAGPRPDIIAVNLPPVVAREPSGALLGIFFIQAVEYILSSAKGLQNPDQITLNFSFALSGGPRRGRHVLERSLQALIEHHFPADEPGQTPVKVVLPAGNRNLAGGHAVRRLQGPADVAQFTWQLQPADATSNMLEIWVSRPAGTAEFDPPVTLDLVAPTGEAISAIFDSASQGARQVRLGDDVIGQVIRHPSAPEWREPADSFSLSVILAGTDPGLTGRSPAPPGPWTLRLSMENAAGVTVEAWVMRDDTIPGFNDNGRQSYLLDPQYEVRDYRGVPKADASDMEGLRRAGTLNALATGGHDNVVTVGAATLQMGTLEDAPTPSLYSASPLPPESPMNQGETVDRAAIADRSPVLPGVLGAGTLSGSRRRMGGTSVAAPQVARALAAGNPPRPAAVRAGRRLGQSVERSPEKDLAERDDGAP